MATYIQFSGWNPNVVVYGYPGNDSSLHILHQATTSFPIQPNIKTDIGPLVSEGLTSFIRVDGTLTTPVPTYLTLEFFSSTSISSVLLAAIDKEDELIRILSPNFFLPSKLFTLDATTGNFFAYIGIRSTVVSGTTLQLRSSSQLTLNGYILYSSAKAPSTFALPQDGFKIPNIPDTHC